MSTPKGEPKPARWRSTVRTGDCDWFGHVNNAVYTDYLASATLSAWGALFPESEWRLRGLAVDFRSPLTHGEQIETILWPSGPVDGTPDRVTCGYRIVRLPDGEVAAEARTSWALDGGPTRRAHAAGGPEAPVAEWPADTAHEPLRLRSAPADPNRPEAHVYRRELVVQPYETDHTGVVSAMWIFRWTWASMLFASGEAGWPVERWKGTGLVVYQNHRDAELYQELRAGDTVEVESRLHDLHRVHGTWEHRILRDGVPVAIDQATGVFLNLEGRITPPPTVMMESIIAGRDLS